MDGTEKCRAGGFTLVREGLLRHHEPRTWLALAASAISIWCCWCRWNCWKPAGRGANVATAGAVGAACKLAPGTAGAVGMGSAVTAAVRGSSAWSVRALFVDVRDAVLALRAPLARLVTLVLMSLAVPRETSLPTHRANGDRSERAA